MCLSLRNILCTDYFVHVDLYWSVTRSSGSVTTYLRAAPRRACEHTFVRSWDRSEKQRLQAPCFGGLGGSAGGEVELGWNPGLELRFGPRSPFRV